MLTLPEGYLLEVLQPLAQAGILLSLRGPNGGYRLAWPAGRITLREVIEAVDGPLRGGAGAGKVGGPLGQVLRRVAGQARRLLAGVTVADLAGRGK